MDDLETTGLVDFYVKSVGYISMAYMYHTDMTLETTLIIWDNWSSWFLCHICVIHIFHWYVFHNNHVIFVLLFPHGCTWRVSKTQFLLQCTSNRKQNCREVSEVVMILFIYIPSLINVMESQNFMMMSWLGNVSHIVGPLWGESTVTKAASHWSFVRGIHCHQSCISLVLCEGNPLSPKLCLTGPLWGESTVTKAASHWSFVRGIHCHQSCISLVHCEGNPLSPKLHLTGPLWGESTVTKAASHWSFVRGIHCHQSFVSLVLCEGNPLSPVDSPHKGPMIWSFDAFFVVSLNKMLNKFSSCQWFEIWWCSCDNSAMFYSFGSLQEQNIIMNFRG